MPARSPSSSPTRATSTNTRRCAPIPLPKDWLLIPGVIDTTTNFVEHPQVVARRIEEAVAAVGDRERVIASTDCGFGTFAGREWVAASIVWRKLEALREGADIASARLWGRRLAGRKPGPGSVRDRDRGPVARPGGSILQS